MKPTAVVTFHTNPYTCGVARFNIALAESLQIPLLTLNDFLAEPISGALLSIKCEEIGEENFAGTFLSESKKHGNTRSFRKGFTTTHKSKLSSCAKLKQWVETDKIEIASKPLLRELKTFIARGNSFAAKEGEHDDLVMALVLIVRMALEITKYEEDAFEYLGTSDDDDYDEPMPMSFL